MKKIDEISQLNIDKKIKIIYYGGARRDGACEPPERPLRNVPCKPNTAIKTRKHVLGDGLSAVNTISA